MFLLIVQRQIYKKLLFIFFTQFLFLITRHWRIVRKVMPMAKTSLLIFSRLQRDVFEIARQYFDENS